jgi:hypothetical protein
VEVLIVREEKAGEVDLGVQVLQEEGAPVDLSLDQVLAAVAVGHKERSKN